MAESRSREEYLQLEVNRLRSELAEAKKEIAHWKVNHDSQVRSKRRGHEIQADIIADLRDELDALRAQLTPEREG